MSDPSTLGHTAANPPTAIIRVAIVDDQALLRAGFRLVIESQPDLTVVAEANDGAEAVALLSAAEVDVVLMDIRMPNLDGIAATTALTAAWAGLEQSPRIVVLTTFDLDEYALSAIRAGASGFLLKDTPPEEMLNAIRTVHRGDAVIAPSTTRRLLDHLAATPQNALEGTSTAGGGNLAEPLRGSNTHQGAAEPAHPRRAAAVALIAELTDRETEVLVLVAQGCSNQEIASDLFVAEATVKTHIGRILAKLGARDRVQTVVIAYDAGLVHP